MCVVRMLVNVGGRPAPGVVKRQPLLSECESRLTGQSWLARSQIRPGFAELAAMLDGTTQTRGALGQPKKR